jgi:hypothetical protein
MGIPKVKVVDSKGRLILGNRYNGKQFLIKEGTDGIIILTPSISVPVKEQWLWSNVAAMDSLQKGLNEAENGQRAEDPMENKDYSWLDKIEE